jgi:hypothetical protein
MDRKTGNIATTINSRVSIASCIVVSLLSSVRRITDPPNIALLICDDYPTEVGRHTTFDVEARTDCE